MNIPRVVSHGGITVDLETIKCFKVQTYSDIGKSNVLTIEFKTSNVDYILNPETEEFELHTFNDKTEVEYPSYDSACAYRDEWAEIWQDYLTEQEEKTTKC
jgi:hypothetical protein